MNGDVSKKKNRTKKCPFCGSRNTAEILYGLPALSNELQERIDAGEIKLGGCCQNGVQVNGKSVNNNPSWYCNECKKKFGAPPLLYSKKSDSHEDCRDVVVKVLFTMDVSRDGVATVEISRNEYGAYVRASDSRIGIMDFPEDRQITILEWNKLIEKLFRKMFVNEWKKEYDNKRWCIMDGTTWKLVIQFSGGRVRTYQGYPEFTPYWRELKTVFGKYVKL